MSHEQYEIEIQRTYYTQNSHLFDTQNIHPNDEHYFALGMMVGLLDFLKVQTILDIGAGTGRTLLYLREKRPDIHVIGIEPALSQREVGYSKGLSPEVLREGDGTRLCFPNQSFDLVCAFGVLHHIKHPESAVDEMLRVAKTAIFISDSNSAGQGTLVGRTTKQLLRAVHLWNLAKLIKTRGRGYHMSDGDGLFYSFSIFDHYRQIEAQCKTIHLTNTLDGRINLYRCASHIALLGIKKYSQFRVE